MDESAEAYYCKHTEYLFVINHNKDRGKSLHKNSDHDLSQLIVQ